MDKAENVASRTVECFDDDAGRNMLNYLEKLGCDINSLSDEFGSTPATSKRSRNRVTLHLIQGANF